MITHRPCGVCVALVPARTGCQHWQPNRARVRPSGAEYRKRRAAEQAEVDKFATMMGAKQ